MDGKQIIQELYHNVDRKNVGYLEKIMCENIHFQIGNNKAIDGKELALAANRSFFESIDRMRHTIDEVWQDQNDLICKGHVAYKRLNGSEFSAPFATFLKMSNDKIDSYLVYADVSAL